MPGSSNKMMLRKKQERAEPNDDIDEVIEGKRSYKVDDKLTSKLYNESYVRELSGHEVSFSHFQTNGFDKPIIVKDMKDLGLIVPEASEFTVDTVLEHVGAKCPIEAINSLTQASEPWDMAKWVKYYNTPREQRKKIWNVISLEFTGTSLDDLVQSPTVVREVDWAQKAWPLDLMYIDIEQIASQEELTFPKVIKYCLMSVAGCYTDFHIDLGGTSVWYHILRGQKVFWLVPPTEDNLQAYEDWSMGGEQEHTFLADKCSGCQRLTLHAGDTFLIPTGWIHAVYTPEDSLVFGGNFLHSFNVGLQLRVAAMEDKFKIGTKYKYPYFHEMQWYIYDHYNIALTGKSYMKLDDQPVNELCEIVTQDPVLSRYELQGLRNLREWLPNQDNDMYPDELDKKQALLDSMMFAIAKHKGDGEKTPYPLKCSLLQWNKSILSSYKKKCKQARKGHNSAQSTTTSRKRQSSTSSRASVSSKASEGSASATSSKQRKSVTPDGKKTKPNTTPDIKKTKPNTTPGSSKLSTSASKARRARCMTCSACKLTEDCMKCIYCKDKPKYGGKGTMKQACVNRKCLMLGKGGSVNTKQMVNDPKQRKLFMPTRSSPRKSATPQKLKSQQKSLLTTEPASPLKGTRESPRSKKMAQPNARAGKVEKQQTLTQLMPSRSSTRMKTPNKKYIDDYEAELPQHLSTRKPKTPAKSSPDTPAKPQTANKVTPSISSRMPQKTEETSLRSQRKGEPVTYSPVRPEKLLGEGKDMSAKQFGYSQAHLESILASANSERLSINNGDVLFYRTKPGTPGSEIRVYVKQNKNPGNEQTNDQVDTDNIKTSSAAKKRSDETSAKTPNTASSKNPAQVKVAANTRSKGSSFVTSPLKEAQSTKRKSESSPAPSPKKAKIETTKPVDGMEGVSSSKKHVRRVFLCMSQAMDDDGEMLYNGHVMTVGSDHYLHKMAEKPGQQKVSFISPDSKGDKVGHVLPLVYPRSADLVQYQRLSEKQISAKICTLSDKDNQSAQVNSSNQQSNVSPLMSNASNQTTTNSFSNTKKNVNIAPRPVEMKTIRIVGQTMKTEKQGPATATPAKEGGGKMRLTTTIHADRPLELEMIKKTLQASGLGKYTIGQVIIKNENNKFVHTVPLMDPVPTDTMSSPESVSINITKSLAKSVTDKGSSDLLVTPMKPVKTYGSKTTPKKPDEGSNQQSETKSSKSGAEEGISIDLPAIGHSKSNNILLISNDLPPIPMDIPKNSDQIKYRVEQPSPLKTEPISKPIVPYISPKRSAFTLVNPPSKHGEIPQVIEVKKGSTPIRPEIKIIRQSEGTGKVIVVGGDSISIPSSCTPESQTNTTAEIKKEQDDSGNKKTLTDYFQTVGTKNKAKPTVIKEECTTVPTGGQSILKSNQTKQKKQPTTIPRRKDMKRIQACGDCDACNAPNCEICIYCRDMKKYGGPGKMKQKCLQRLCRRITSSTLHKHAEKTGIITARGQKKLRNYLKTVADNSKGDKADISNIMSEEDSGGEKIYQGVIRAEYLSLKKVPNCGSCASCRGTKKSMCLKKKGRIQATIAQLEKQQLDAKSPSKVFEEINTESTSNRPSRVRKPTQKMCESIQQTSSTYGWTENISQNVSQNVSQKAPEISSIANALLESYISSQHEDNSDEEDSDDDAASDDETDDEDEEVGEEESHEDALSKVLIEASLMDAVLKEDAMSNSPVIKLQRSPIKGPMGSFANPEVLQKEEVIAAILKHLSLADVASCALVCKAWNVASQEPSLWSNINLSKRTIDQSVAESINCLQPRTLTLNMAVSTPNSLKVLLSNLNSCQELSLRGVSAVKSLDLSHIPPTVTSLDLSHIPGLDDQTFKTLFTGRSSLPVKILDLSRTDVGDASLKLIATKLPRLNRLILSNCSCISNSGIDTLASQPEWPLTSLEVTNCDKIDDRILNILFKCIGFENLVEMDMNGCPLIAQSDIRDFVKRYHGADKANLWKFSRRLIKRDLS